MTEPTTLCSQSERSNP